MTAVINWPEAGNSPVNYKEWAFHNVEPIYTQLRNKIKWAILSGQLRPGESIPSVREMASLLLINPNTVSKAYKLVCDEGLIETTGGKTYKVVSDNVIIQKVRAKECQILSCNYVRGMMELGFSKTESSVLIKEYIQGKIQGEAE